MTRKELKDAREKYGFQPHKFYIEDRGPYDHYKQLKNISKKQLKGVKNKDESKKI